MLSRRPGGGRGRAPVAVEEEQHHDEDPLGELMQAPQRRDRGGGTREDPLEKLRRKGQAAISSGDVDAEAFIGLFILKHEATYEVTPQYLRLPETKLRVMVRGVANFLKQHLPTARLEYMEWCWDQKARESWWKWMNETGHLFSLKGATDPKTVTLFHVWKRNAPVLKDKTTVISYGPTRVNGRIVNPSSQNWTDNEEAEISDI